MPDWQNNLDKFFARADSAKQEKDIPPFARFVREIAIPAFEEIKPVLEGHGRTVTIRDSDSSATIGVAYNGHEEMTYRIRERLCVDRNLPYAEIRVRERKGLRLITVESMLRSGAPDYALEDITKDEVRQAFLQQYMTRVKPT